LEALVRVRHHSLRAYLEDFVNVSVAAEPAQYPFRIHTRHLLFPVVRAEECLERSVIAQLQEVSV
jgi:hypothetical protein